MLIKLHLAEICDNKLHSIKFHCEKKVGMPLGYVEGLACMIFVDSQEIMVTNSIQKCLEEI